MSHPAHHGTGSPSRSRPRLLASRAASALSVFAATGVAALSLGSGSAVAAGCPNATVRDQQGASAVPDCRAYELVTSPFKEGFSPSWIGYSDDGVFAYKAAGNFAGNGLGSVSNAYAADRSGTRWATTPANPSGPMYAGAEGLSALSPDLRSSVWVMRRPGDSAAATDYYVRRPDDTFTRVGPSVNPDTAPSAPPGPSTVGFRPDFRGASSDLSHLIFTDNASQVFSGVAVTGFGGQFLYEYVGVGNDRPRYVGVDNDGDQISTCGTFAGSAPNGSAFHAISTDGRMIYFSPVACAGGPAATKVWARVDGTTSYFVSKQQCTGTSGDPGGSCTAEADALFEGANADGSRVFFTTSQQLVNGDTDQTTDLYACDLVPGTPAPSGQPDPPCPSLTQVSGAAGARVLGVVRISDDGSRVYFVAQGVLASNHGANDAPAVAGDNNLYVWRKDAAHPAGQTVFVGQLAASDASLWGPDANAPGRMAQVTDDGRYLVLSTYSPLIAGGPGGDTDAARDVYRYDADTGALARMSADTSGGGGNADGFDATISPVEFSTSIPARTHPAMTSDGQAVVFMTSDALSPNDTNGQPDIYEWRDGQVALISSGRTSLVDTALGTFAWITSSGSDIYFATTEQMTFDDADTLPDVYDARVGGGFAAPPGSDCVPDCQGDGTAPPVVPAPGSDTPTGHADIPSVAPSFSLRPVSAAQRKKLASTGKVTLSVTANTPGTVAAKATATIARRSVSVASARRTTAAPGTVSLALSLSKKARAELAAKGRLTVKVVVSSSKVAVTRSATLKLTHAKAKAKEHASTKHKKKTTGKPKQASKRSLAGRSAVSDSGGRS